MIFHVAFLIMTCNRTWFQGHDDDERNEQKQFLLRYIYQKI